MSTNQKRILWPVMLTGVLAVAALGYARKSGWGGFKPISKLPANQQKPSSSANPNPKSSIRRGFLKPQLIPILVALGDRLEKPGKERVTITGTLISLDDTQPRQVVAILEFPDKLHLTIVRGAQTEVLTFDGQHAATTTGSLTSQDLSLIEALVYDAADHFFSTQLNGKAARYLGSRFRADDGVATDYRGPYHDIYQVADLISLGAEPERRSKFYYFNSDSLLLDRVNYQVNRTGSDISVDNVISDWQKNQGQQIPGRIERRENDKSVFSLTVRTAVIGPHIDDGVFDITQGR